MPASERLTLEVEPAMNQRSSAMTARKKTRFVVRRGSIGVSGDEGVVEGREREKRKGVGANSERVPVPVLDQYELDGHTSSYLPLLLVTCLDDAPHLGGLCGSIVSIGTLHAMEKQPHY